MILLVESQRKRFKEAINKRTWSWVTDLRGFMDCFPFSHVARFPLSLLTFKIKAISVDCLCTLYSSLPITDFRLKTWVSMIVSVSHTFNFANNETIPFSARDQGRIALMTLAIAKWNIILYFFLYFILCLFCQFIWPSLDKREKNSENQTSGQDNKIIAVTDITMNLDLLKSALIKLEIPPVLR